MEYDQGKSNLHSQWLLEFNPHLLSKMEEGQLLTHIEEHQEYKNQLQKNALLSESSQEAYTQYFHKKNKLALCLSYSVWKVQSQQF